MQQHSTLPPTRRSARAQHLWTVRHPRRRGRDWRNAGLGMITAAAPSRQQLWARTDIAQNCWITKHYHCCYGCAHAQHKLGARKLITTCWSASYVNAGLKSQIKPLCSAIVTSASTPQRLQSEGCCMLTTFYRSWRLHTAYSMLCGTAGSLLDPAKRVCANA